MLSLIDRAAPTAPDRRVLKTAHDGVVRAKRHIIVLHHQDIIDPCFKQSVRRSDCIVTGVNLEPVPAAFLNVHARPVVKSVLCARWAAPQLLGERQRGTVVLDHHQKIVTPRAHGAAREITSGEIVEFCADWVPVERI